MTSSHMYALHGWIKENERTQGNLVGTLIHEQDGRLFGQVFDTIIQTPYRCLGFIDEEQPMHLRLYKIPLKNNQYPVLDNLALVSSDVIHQRTENMNHARWEGFTRPYKHAITKDYDMLQVLPLPAFKSLVSLIDRHSIAEDATPISYQFSQPSR